MGYLRSRPDLLRRFRSGEREALAEVYRAYLPEVTQVLRRGFVVRSNGLRIPGCTNRQDLADVLQEVFIRTFKREAREAYDGQRDYGAYLATVARNVVIDRYRKGAREQLGIDPELLCTAELTAPDLVPDDAPWIDARSLEITRRYVADLEGPLREVHSARYVAALSQRDAARELGFSRPKVRKLEQRLRRELLRLLNQVRLWADRTDEHAVARDTQDTWTTKPRTSETPCSRAGS